MDAGSSLPSAAVQDADAGLSDAASSFQRATAPRSDVARQSMQQRDNPRALATARCHQQERCGFIHQGGKYILAQQCLAVVLDQQRDALVKYSCPKNTNPIALQSCLEAVRGMDCAHPFTSFDALSECSTAVICRNSNATIPAPE